MEYFNLYCIPLTAGSERDVLRGSKISPKPPARPTMAKTVPTAAAEAYVFPRKPEFRISKLPDMYELAPESEKAG
eukprot:135117-Amorphochlora_amoeboformis.AAC.2